jgi:hypothetical protein
MTADSPHEPTLTAKLLSFDDSTAEPVPGGERRSIHIVGAFLQLTVLGSSSTISDFFATAKAFGYLKGSLDELTADQRCELEAGPLNADLVADVSSSSAIATSNTAGDLTISIELHPDNETGAKFRKFYLEIDPGVDAGVTHKWITPCKIYEPSVSIRVTVGDVAASLYAIKKGKIVGAAVAEGTSESFTLSGWVSTGISQIEVRGEANGTIYDGIVEGYTGPF